MALYNLTTPFLLLLLLLLLLLQLKLLLLLLVLQVMLSPYEKTVGVAKNPLFPLSFLAFLSPRSLLNEFRAAVNMGEGERWGKIPTMLNNIFLIF